MFSYNEAALPYTWSSYTSGGLRHVRKDQRIDHRAVDWSSCTCHKIEFTGAQLQRLGYPASADDTGFMLDVPVNYDQGKPAMPLFGRLGDDADGDYVVLDILHAVPRT